MNVFEFPTSSKQLSHLNENRRINQYHDAYWLGIHKRIVEDRERLRQKNQTPFAITIGLEEYKTLINIFSRREGNFTCPKFYRKIPIVLAPIDNLCAVVPTPDRYWFEFVEK